MIIDSTILDRIQEIENTWITLSDGCRIAARIWLPKTADTDPVPAILEYIPYRKRDFMRSRDEPIHRYFAAHPVSFFATAMFLVGFVALVLKFADVLSQSWAMRKESNGT